MLMVENLPVLDSLNFVSTCHYLHDNPPYDPTLLELLELVNSNRRDVYDSSGEMTEIEISVEDIDNLTEEDINKLVAERMVDLGITTEEEVDLNSLVGEMPKRTFDRLFLSYRPLKRSTLDIISEQSKSAVQNTPILYSLMDLCERHQDYEEFSVSMSESILALALDEDLYYRALHLLWHHNTAGVRQVVDLERFIHLAIATDNLTAYEHLIFRRKEAVLKDFTCYNRENVTDQDVYSVIRYGSKEIYDYLSPLRTGFLYGLLGMTCEHNDLIEMEDDYREYSKECGICNKAASLKQIYQEHMEIMLAMGPCLPD